MGKILVVEDDEMINEVVTEFLKEKNYQVVSVDDGKKALDAFASESFDLILLDIMLPSISGIEVLKKIRTTSMVPIIMMTAIEDECTQLISFNHVINDYVVKPFSPVILMKRIENVLRDTPKKSTLTILDYTFNLEDSMVYYKGEAIFLTKKEYDILEVLIRRVGSLVTRENLVVQIWGYHDYMDSRILDNHIKNLRKKLPHLPLQTIKGMGYKLEDMS